MMDLNKNELKSGKKHRFLGRHILGELYGIDYEILDNLSILEKALSLGIKRSEARCEGMLVKKFNPSGVTIVALLSESHASIHTYPECNALFIDAFTCGNTCDPQAIIDVVVEIVKPQKIAVKEMKRGNEL
ncbi:adenosylmethionine decarboxylase [Clostridium sp. KNHs214]|uniref:adenosylmethionine decarboxylase n=1 Tax=Clostridium sp. KNHs214 TaxID=1540257 RepID=UPI000ADC0FCE|nr:adenosylmethionine decarboxylase [Clostridium sp. KNHs214]